MTDPQLLQYFRKFLSSEDKPDSLQAIDLLLTVRLLVQHADESNLYVSQGTLATQLCVSEDTIARSIERLKASGWLLVRKGGYRMRTNLYSIDLAKLPQDELTKTYISPAAKKLAQDYGNAAGANARKKYVLRNWRQTWAFQCQWLMNHCGGDSAKARCVINFCWQHATNTTYRKLATQGPHKLRKVWIAAVHEYDAVQAAKIAAAPAPSPVGA